MNKFQTAVMAALVAVSPAAAGGMATDFDGAGSRSGCSAAEAARGSGVPAAALPARAAAFGPGNRIIYGADDRLDRYEAPDIARAAMDASVSVWPGETVSFDAAAGLYRLAVRPIGEARNLCPGVRFSEQFEGPKGGSGVLVGEDLVLTAGHVVDDAGTCGDRFFVFGFDVTEAGGAAPSAVPAENVYRCKEIVAQEYSLELSSGYAGLRGQDYALIRLDRKVAGRKPLGVNRHGGIKPGTPVFSVGYPMGLPLKFAPGTAGAYAAAGRTFFNVDNFDVFGGSSGSPVINAATGLVEGVLFGAIQAWKLATPEGCYVYRVLPEYAGEGAAANRLDPLLDMIPL